jgi:SAM-dependent methyltransferase
MLAEQAVATPGIATLGASGPSLRDARCGAMCQVNTVSVHLSPSANFIPLSKYSDSVKSFGKSHKLIRSLSEGAMTFNSAQYWERRYSSGKTSGSGSYGRLAQYKADFLNNFIEANQISSVLDMGCGDGNQLSLLRDVPYVGVDVSAAVLEKNRTRFADRPNTKFLHVNDLAATDLGDLAMSNDVIYHLIEDEVFERYMRTLFLHARRCVVIYSSNEHKTGKAKHIKHRKFTDFVSKEILGWTLVQDEPNPFSWDPENKNETSFANFHVFKSL